MTKRNEIEFESNIVCPWCRRSQRDARGKREYDLGTGVDEELDVECESCERTFRAVRHVSFTYSTRKIGDEKP